MTVDIKLVLISSTETEVPLPSIVHYEQCPKGTISVGRRIFVSSS